MNAALLAFVHHALAFVMFATLMVELVLLRGELTLQSARSILRMDAVYGICAGLLVAIGFLRVFYTEKGSAYYFTSGPFMAKMTLFAAVGLLSIYPTLRFLSWRKALAAGAVPVIDSAQQGRLRAIIHVELTLVLGILLAAALMARGIGVIGT